MQSTQDALATLPLYHVDEVWHVGSFKPEDKNMHGSSQEGSGLSVSECPEDWCSIVRLGGYPTWQLLRPGAAFLDYHEMTQPQRDALVAWGIEKGYAEMRGMFKLSYYDCEDEDTRVQLLETREEADLEGEEMEDAVIEQVTVPYPTAAMVARLKFNASPIEVLDFLATFYVEDETKLDGVWWHDTYDPAALSAPRGVIMVRALPDWQRQVQA